jgi:hypothetical protein
LLVIKEITPASEPIEEADAAGLNPNATPANVDDANSTPNTSAVKIEDLEANVRALQGEVRVMSKNGAAAYSRPKRMVNETNEGETDKMHPAKKPKTDDLERDEAGSENTSSKPIEDSRP